MNISLFTEIQNNFRIFSDVFNTVDRKILMVTSLLFGFMLGIATQRYFRPIKEKQIKPQPQKKRYSTSIKTLSMQTQIKKPSLQEAKTQLSSKKDSSVHVEQTPKKEAPETQPSPTKPKIRKKKKTAKVSPKLSKTVQTPVEETKDKVIVCWKKIDETEGKLNDTGCKQFANEVESGLSSKYEVELVSSDSMPQTQKKVIALYFAYVGSRLQVTRLNDALKNDTTWNQATQKVLVLGVFNTEQHLIGSDKLKPADCIVIVGREEQDIQNNIESAKDAAEFLKKG